MALTRAEIDRIALKLKAMPAPPTEDVNTTKQEAVRLLAREITGLQKRGYSLEQIAASLKGEGLDLTTPTLKSYLSRAKAGGRRPPPLAGRRKVAATAPPPTAPATSPGAARVPPNVKKEDAPLRSGKDAFLVKDKDSY